MLTNRHVFRNATADGIRIYLADGRQLHPQRVLEDEETDVGVLAVEAADLIASPVGDSDRMEIGDFVLAVGSPFGLSHSVTFGIISARGRHDLQLGDDSVRFQDFLADRRGHQSRQQRRPVVQLARRDHRHQHGHRQQFRRQRGHRLLDPHQSLHGRGPAVDRHRQGDAGLPGRESRREVRPGHGRRVGHGPGDRHAGTRRSRAADRPRPPAFVPTT